MMSGVNHQPVQKDVSKAIHLTNKLFPGYEFIHSNFTSYLEAVRQESLEDLDPVEEELMGRGTDNWYALANTASVHAYLK